MSFICIVCRDSLTTIPDQSNDGAAGGSEDPVMLVTQCGHTYHEYCLLRWFKRSASPLKRCPYCQTVLPTNGYHKIFCVGNEEASDEQKEFDLLKFDYAVKDSEYVDLKQQFEQNKLEMATIKARNRDLLKAIIKAKNIINGQIGLNPPDQNQNSGYGRSIGRIPRTPPLITLEDSA